MCGAFGIGREDSAQRLSASEVNALDRGLDLEGVAAVLNACRRQR